MSHGNGSPPLPPLPSPPLPSTPLNSFTYLLTHSLLTPPYSLPTYLPTYLPACLPAYLPTYSRIQSLACSLPTHAFNRSL